MISKNDIIKVSEDYSKVEAEAVGYRNIFHEYQDAFGFKIGEDYLGVFLVSTYIASY